jgi:deazaflavin-dependent oxidoreductase (nitroreductase family)
VSTRYVKPDWFTNHVFNPTVALCTRMGLSVWGSRVLRVRGRKSGEWRESPVNLLTFEGNRYLLAPRGNTQWVRNIRVSNEGELKLGSHVEKIRVTEIPDDQKIAILRAYLQRWKFEVGMFFSGVSADSPESDVRRIAPDHPVFRVETA